MEADVRQEFDEIKAILKAVAKSQAAADARMDRSDERFDKRMRGFEKLVRIGMAELRRFEKETDRKIDALVNAQQRTEASLKAFLDSLRKGGNGHQRGQSR